MTKIEIEKALKRSQRNLRRSKRQVADLRATVARQGRDLSDCFGAVQTSFQRCACGRLRETGLICPSNLEVPGSCKAGL